MLTAALFTVAKTGRQPPRPPTEEQVKKMWGMCVIGYYSAVRKNEILPFAAAWMKLEIIILNEVSQRKHIQYDAIYMWNLKYDMNERVREAEAESWVRRTYWCLPGAWGWRRERLGLCGEQMQTSVYRMCENKRGRAV